MLNLSNAFSRIDEREERRVSIVLNGVVVTAFEGEALAIALASLGHVRLRSSPRAGGPRGAFCFMGICQECVVSVEGRLLRSCITPVRAGMIVELGETS